MRMPGGMHTGLPASPRGFVSTPADQEIIETSEALNVALMHGRQPGISAARDAWLQALEKRRAYVAAGAGQKAPAA